MRSSFYLFGSSAYLFSCLFVELWTVMIGLQSSSSTFTGTSSLRGMLRSILICLIFSGSWDDFRRIYFTRSIIGIRLL